MMKIKDSYWIGFLIGAAVFALCYFPLSLIPWGDAYAKAPLLLSFIPGIILFRFSLVKWNMERCGKGILIINCIGMLLVFFLGKYLVN